MLINGWERATVEQLSMALEDDSSSIEYEIQKLKDNGRVYSMDGELRRV